MKKELELGPILTRMIQTCCCGPECSRVRRAQVKSRAPPIGRGRNNKEKGRADRCGVAIRQVSQKPCSCGDLDGEGASLIAGRRSSLP